MRRSKKGETGDENDNDRGPSRWIFAGRSGRNERWVEDGGMLHVRWVFERIGGTAARGEKGGSRRW